MPRAPRPFRVRPWQYRCALLLSEGASLTPSPVIATIAPFASSALTTRSFCSGMIRANTVAVRTRTANSPLVNCSTSLPVTKSSVSKPACARSLLQSSDSRR